MIEEGQSSLEELYNKILEENKTLQDKLKQSVINTNTNEYEQKRQALLKAEIEEKLKENSFLKFLSDNEGKSIPYLYELVVDSSLDNLKRLEAKHPFKYSHKKMFIQALNRNKRDFLDYLINVKNVEMFDYYDGNRNGQLLGPQFDQDCLFQLSFTHAIAAHDWELFKFLDQNIKLTKRQDINYVQNYNSFENAHQAFMNEKVTKYYPQIATATFCVKPEIFDYVYSKMQMHCSTNSTKLEQIFNVKPLISTGLSLLELQKYISQFGYENGFDPQKIVNIINEGDVEKLKFVLDFNKRCSNSYYCKNCALKEVFKQPKQYIINTMNLNMIKFIAPHMQYDELMELLIKAEKSEKKEIVDYLSTLI
jgi:hypothetical protein